MLYDGADSDAGEGLSQGTRTVGRENPHNVIDHLLSKIGIVVQGIEDGSPNGEGILARRGSAGSPLILRRSAVASPYIRRNRHGIGHEIRLTVNEPVSPRPNDRGQPGCLVSALLNEPINIGHVEISNDRIGYVILKREKVVEMLEKL